VCVCVRSLSLSLSLSLGLRIAPSPRPTRTYVKRSVENNYAERRHHATHGMLGPLGYVLVTNSRQSILVLAVWRGEREKEKKHELTGFNATPQEICAHATAANSPHPVGARYAGSENEIGTRPEGTEKQVSWEIPTSNPRNLRKLSKSTPLSFTPCFPPCAWYSCCRHRLDSERVRLLNCLREVRFTWSATFSAPIHMTDKHMATVITGERGPRQGMRRSGGRLPAGFVNSYH
jgi:hypothetical protein